jgi:putative hemolysin
VIKANIKTDINATSALVRMKNPDAFACTKGGGVLVMWTDDAGNCHRAKLCDF